VSAVIDALAAECAAFCSALDGVTATDWQRTTNCPPWDVKELAAHVYGSTMVDPSRLSPPDGAPVVEAADYYRRAVRATTEYRRDNVEHWQRFASRFGSPEDVVEACVRDWPPMIERLRTEDPQRLIGMRWGVAMTLDDYLVSRVIGVAAHGVDVAITLGLPRRTTPEALRVARPALVSLLGEEPRSELAWSDQDLLETGTGRRALTDRERAILAAAVSRFPLLS
jgi:uncharacterized protein (TIGR03083 family)